MSKITLYHTGFQEIRQPDLHIGRANADFGQGFYLSPDEAFSRRWARSRRDRTTWLNTYVLDTDGLNVKAFVRDEEWYDYIFHNRAGYRDSMKDYDVITGPIANDTIYDTWGILTSGLLSREDSLRLLILGPAYEQTVIKTEKGAANLQFISAQSISEEEIDRYRETVRQEEKAYQESIFDHVKKYTDQWD